MTFRRAMQLIAEDLQEREAQAGKRYSPVRIKDIPGLIIYLLHTFHRFIIGKGITAQDRPEGSRIRSK